MVAGYYAPIFTFNDLAWFRLFWLISVTNLLKILNDSRYPRRQLLFILLKAWFTETYSCDCQNRNEKDQTRLLRWLLECCLIFD